MAISLTAGRGVTQVIDRCEEAKTSGYLNLSSCSLMYVADAIYLVLKGCEVDKVNIRNNSLKKFPMKMVTKFPNATIINLESNEITQIPHEFGEWKSLRGVNAANNRLAVFPEAFYSLERLFVLDLGGNQITELDVDRLYSGCPGLAKLNLAENPISEEVKKQLETHPKKPKGLDVVLK